jgi:parallel beta-helix repeat protein
LTAAALQVSVSPGQDIQKAVNSLAAGGTILMKAGIYRRQSIVPKDGMTFVGENGAILDGDGVVNFAFNGTKSGKVVANNVTIRNLEIRGYSSDLGTGPIMAALRQNVQTSGWVVEDCNIHHNSAGGIKTGNNMVIRGNWIHDNGQVGISGSGDGILIVDNEVSINNTRDVRKTEGLAAAGGMKLLKTKNLVVRGNYFHDNNAPGIWIDRHAVNTLIENNRVINNAGAGIFIEISYGATVRNNTASGNGFKNARWLYGGGITVSSTPDVEVYGNTVGLNARGITAVHQDRGTGPLGKHEVRNLYVHDNKITMKSEDGTVTGLAVGTGESIYYTKKGNRFKDNSYCLGSQSKYFYWNSKRLTKNEWKSSGNDVGGNFGAC